MTQGGLSGGERFGLHSLKQPGVTDTNGDKKLASIHKTDAMMHLHDHSRPLVHPTDWLQALFRTTQFDVSLRSQEVKFASKSAGNIELSVNRNCTISRNRDAYVALTSGRPAGRYRSRCDESL